MDDRYSRRGFFRLLTGMGLAAGASLMTRQTARAASPSSGALAQPTPTIEPAAIPSIPADEQVFLASHELKLGDTSRPVVMMSYDDVLDPVRLTHLLDVYREHSVHCTFFIIGVDLATSAEILPRIIAEGHDLGCHGWVHDSAFTTLSDDSIHHQFGRYFTQVEKYLPGYRVRYFRAPFGDRNQHVRDLAAMWGMRHVLWSLESGGLDLLTEHYVVDRAQNGDIVLSHAHRPFDVSEANVIVRELVRKGFQLENLTSGMSPADRWPQP
jgi:peptidoglycan-N-acetylmuramic acid deacetylase